MQFVCLGMNSSIRRLIRMEQNGRRKAERERLLSCGYWVGVMSIREDDRCDSSVDTVDVKDIGWTL